MRRWLAAAGEAGSIVSDRPVTWLAGALAWIVTVGWIPFVVGVARPPTVSDLTFLGARIFGSGLWPWNAIAIGLGVFALIGLAFGLAALAEGTLLDLLGPRRAGWLGSARLLGIAIVVAAPAVFTGLLAAIVLVTVAPIEFSSPDTGGGPVVRTLVRMAPFLAVVAVATAVGAAIHAAAARLVHDRGEDALGALRGSLRLLASALAPTLLQLLVVGVARVVVVIVAALLLRVLWAPIGAELAVAGLDLRGAALLVGFVAIWLCLVLAGGALHAWGSATWSLLLTGHVASAGTERRRHEISIDR